MKLRADRFRFLINGRGLEVVGQKPLPVGLARVMNRVPVPVFDHLRARCEMAHCLKSQLSGEWRPRREALRFGFKYEIGRLLQTPDLVAELGNLDSGQMHLRRMIDVASRDVETLRDLIVIDIRLNARRAAARKVEVEVVGDELILPRILSHNRRLPREKLRDERPLEFLKFRRKAPVDRPAYIWHVLPCVHPVAPVVEPEGGIERVGRAELIPEIPDKHSLDVFACGAVVFGFVVDLEADDRRMLRHMANQLPDHPFAVEKIGGRGDVHDLSRAVGTPAGLGVRHDLRVHFIKPGRDRIGRRADNNVDSRLMHLVQHPVDVAVVKDARTRLEGRPGRFGDPNEIDPGLLHHLDVLVQPLAGHIFIVISDAVIQLFHHVLPFTEQRCSSNGAQAPPRSSCLLLQR